MIQFECSLADVDILKRINAKYRNQEARDRGYNHRKKIRGWNDVGKVRLYCDVRKKSIYPSGRKIASRQDLCVVQYENREIKINIPSLSTFFERGIEREEEEWRCCNIVHGAPDQNLWSFPMPVSTSPDLFLRCITDRDTRKRFILKATSL
jgi:hypothetical protein